MNTRSVSTAAIVLKRSNVGEADRIVTLLTEEQGKITCIAKGVRKINSSNRANLEPGNLITAYLITTKSLPILTQTRLINDFASSKQTLVKMRQLTQILEMLDRLFVENVEDSALFQDITQILRDLNAPSRQHQLRERLQALLGQLGYQTLEDSGHATLLEYIAEITDRPMRSWEYLTLKN